MGHGKQQVAGFYVNLSHNESLTEEENIETHKGWLNLFAICETEQGEKMVHCHKGRLRFLHIISH